MARTKATFHKSDFGENNLYKKVYLVSVSKNWAYSIKAQKCPQPISENVKFSGSPGNDLDFKLAQRKSKCRYFDFRDVIDGWKVIPEKIHAFRAPALN